MTDKTLSLLKESGWSEDRRMEISNYEDELKEEGYIVNDTIREFLRSFGGLKVIHPHHHVETSKDEFYETQEFCLQKE